MNRSTILIALFFLAFSCTGKEGEREEAQGPDPSKKIVEILQLHNMLGKQPEQRTEAEKQVAVPREILSNLFADLDANDKFITDIYVGFVIGVLARNQTRLFVTRRGNRATVRAGELKVEMILEKGGWQIVLATTVPESIKIRAEAEWAKTKSARASAASTALP